MYSVSQRNAAKRKAVEDGMTSLGCPREVAHNVAVRLPAYVATNLAGWLREHIKAFHSRGRGVPPGGNPQ